MKAPNVCMDVCTCLMYACYPKHGLSAMYVQHVMYYVYTHILHTHICIYILKRESTCMQCTACKFSKRIWLTCATWICWNNPPPRNQLGILWFWRYHQSKSWIAGVLSDTQYLHALRARCIHSWSCDAELWSDIDWPISGLASIVYTI